jgi:steroid delta-isomerase-like uncharacterized protein
MPDDKKALAYRWFEEVWNQGRAEAIDEMFDEGAVAYGLEDESGGERRGPAGFKPFFHQFRAAFPDLKITVEDVIAEGDKVAIRCSVRGTHTGEGLQVAASGRPIAVTGISIIRVKDGKIVESWNNFDFLALFQQIGALNQE